MAVTTYSEGTVSVTNGSATVTMIAPGVAPGNVLAGQVFQVAGDDVAYTVAADAADATFQLTAPYAGVTDAAAAYSLNRDFVEDIPVPRRGDTGPWAVLAEAVKRLVARLNGKADDAATTAALATKADDAATTAALATKADDATNQIGVLDSTLADPPVGPTAGDAYIVAAAATGAWAGHETELAVWGGAAWMFYVPAEGWLAYDRSADQYLTFDGAAWGALVTGGGSDAAFAVHKNGIDQTGVADSTFTLVTWPVEDFDVGGYFASNAWTPPAGKVLMSAVVRILGDFPLGAQAALAIFKNGSAVQQVDYAAMSGNAVVNGTLVDQANGTDTYDVRVYIDLATGTGTISGLAFHSKFSGFRIST